MDTIKLADPDGAESELEFGLGIANSKWTEQMVVCWVHQHRLIGLVSDKGLKAAQNNEPFYLHEVCAWISQVGIMPTPKGTQVQSVRAIVRYDNAGTTLAKLRVTQSHAVLRVADQDPGLVEWMVASYKAQARPSDIQIVNKLPGSSD